VKESQVINLVPARSKGNTWVDLTKAGEGSDELAPQSHGRQDRIFFVKNLYEVQLKNRQNNIYM